MLSARQLAIYQFIRQWQLDRHYPPTVREIVAGAGISSTSVVAYNLFRLREAGVIEYDSEEARSARVAGSRYILPELPGVVRQALEAQRSSVGKPSGNS